MQEFIQTMQYVRIFIYLALFGLTILSMRSIFRKIPRFGMGLLFALGSLFVVTGISYFVGPELATVIGGIVFTLVLVGWVIAWAMDLAYYDKE